MDRINRLRGAPGPAADRGPQSRPRPRVGRPDGRRTRPARLRRRPDPTRRPGSDGRSGRVRGRSGERASPCRSFEGHGILRPADGPSRGTRDRAEIAQLVEHATENRGVASSNLALGTIQLVGASSSGSGSVGRASPCQGEGRGFESRLPLHFPPHRDRLPAPLPLRLVVGQRTLDPLAEVRILEGQPTRHLPGDTTPDPATWRRGLTRRSAKPLFIGSNPIVAST